MVITLFNSVGEYCRFVVAKEFCLSTNGEQFLYEKNYLERIGDGLIRPFLGSTDGVLRSIKRPLFIVAAALVIIALLTLIFYPSKLTAVMVRSIEPWMIKLVLHITFQVTILGLGIRAIGRMNNETVAKAWNAHEIIPIPIGAERVER
jgi:hypothetical protein